MSESSYQSQLLYEMALEVGRGYNLFDLLKSSLNSYLKRLKCVTGIVTRIEKVSENNFRSEMIFSIPYALITKTAYNTIENLVPKSFSKTELSAFLIQLPSKGKCDDDLYYHILPMEDFGVCILIRKQSYLEDGLIDLLSGINKKFADACLTCIKIESLEESEMRYRHQQELLPEMLCETDLNGVITYATAYALEKMGYSNSELKAGINILSLFAKEDRDRLVKNFETALVQDSSLANEYTLVNKAGLSFPVQIKTNRLFKNNKVQGLISIIVDITSLKENEKKIIEMNLIRDKLYSIIAHDIRAPFSDISMTLSALSNGYMNPGSDEFRETLLYLEKTAGETSILLDNLLEFTRLQSKAFSIIPKHIHVYRVLMEAVQLLKTNADKKKITLEYNIPEDIVAYFDEVSIYAVFRNIISNAIKFTPENGKIEVSAGIENGLVLVKVKDTGIGLSDELIKKIFVDEEHFTSPGTNNERGSGLGSFIIKDFVKKNNGKLKISSDPGLGTEVFVYLPLEESS